MTTMKTRREFLYDLAALSCVIPLSDPLIQKLVQTRYNLGYFHVDHKDCQEGQINVSYIGVGSVGMRIGEELSEHVGTNIQFAKLREINARKSPFNEETWLQILENHLQKQDIVVLVGKVDNPAFFGLRQFVLPRAPCLWTIGILPKSFKMEKLNLHYYPKEILRLVSGSSSVFQDAENFMQSIIAIYLVQHKYINNDNFQKICQEAFSELGLDILC